MIFEIFWSVDLKCEKESSDEWQITLDNMNVGKNEHLKPSRNVDFHLELTWQFVLVCM